VEAQTVIFLKKIVRASTIYSKYTPKEGDVLMRRYYVWFMAICMAALLSIAGWSPHAGAASNQPSVVTGTSATAGDGQITITFSKNKSGEYPDEYQIHWWNNSSVEELADYRPYVAIPSADVTEANYSYTFKNLSNGITYYFKVYAYKHTDIWSDRGDILQATPVAKPVVSDADKENMIRRSYEDGFGRTPTADELTYWKSRTDWETYEDLIKLHRVHIQTNDKAQVSVITASYYAVFWRGPNEAELKYWTDQLKASGTIFKELRDGHRNYAKNDKIMREALIHNAFRTVLGRDASASELTAWTAQIQAGKVTSYSELVNELRGLLAGNAKLQAEVVRKTYTIAFKRNETAAELKYWQGVIVQNRITFSDMLKTHRDFITKDKNTRSELIAKSYQEVFGRKPDKGENTFWEGRLKNYGLIYGEIVLAHQEWVSTNLAQLKKAKELQDSLAKKGLVLNTKTGDIENKKTKAVVYKEGQYFIGSTDAKGNIKSINGGNVISPAGLTMVAAGGGNIVAAGGGNIVAAGGGNIVAAGGGNIVAAGGGNIVAAGGGNIVAAGGGNIVAAGGGNIVAAGGGNLNPGSLFLLNGGSIMGGNR